MQIDQSASELQLHRVLWLVTFLRAMLLHVALAIIAALCLLLVGIDGVYPLATDMIHAMRAQAMQNRIDGVPVSDALFAVIASIVSVGALLWLRWLYHAITQVRRWALRFQALVMALLVLWLFGPAWARLAYAYEHLDPLFAALATWATLATMVLIPLGVALALWRVSLAPEKSSLVATLDPRLITGWAAYLNKLLDLPRTPMRTPGSAAAYALSLAGSVVLIASTMYLVTAGGTGNKLDVLTTACAHHVELTPRCVALSAHWAATIPWLLLLALIGVKAAALLRALAKRLGGLSVTDVLRSSDDKFLLYLRPFDADEVVLPTPRLPLLSRALSFRPFPVRIEEELFDVADGYRPLIAIGRPGGSKATPGGLAYRTYLDDAQWQDYALDKIRRAEHIVMILKTTEGVRWEFERVMDEGAATRTLFLFEPVMKDSPDWTPIERMVVPSLQRAGLVPPGHRFEARPLGFFFRNGALVEIVNAHWTATSYRTAFSTFLASAE